MAIHPIQTSRPGASAAFAGDFEAHLTVGCDEREIDALGRWAAAQGLKFSHIVLDRGRVVSQPMLTLRGTALLGKPPLGMATLDTAAAATEDLAATLGAAGYDVVRVKIEMTPWGAGVPATDHDAVALGAGFYFEHHLKLVLDSSTQTDALAALAVRHGAHLSRNARRVRQDGRQERFVTQRCRMVGTATARRRLRELTSELRTEQHTITAVEQEFVVFDSDESLDHGWIDEREDEKA